MYKIPNTDEDILLETLTGRLSDINIHQISNDKVSKFTNFVFNVYRLQLKQAGDWTGTKNEREKLLSEEEALMHRGIYFAAIHKSGKFLGGVRGAQWFPGARFPSEDRFNIKILELSKSLNVSPTDIMHGSLTSVDEEGMIRAGYKNGDTRKVFIALLKHCFCALKTLKIKYVLGDTDLLIERKYRQLGITWTPVSNWGDYFGMCRASLLDVEEALKTKTVKSLIGQSTVEQVEPEHNHLPTRNLVFH